MEEFGFIPFNPSGHWQLEWHIPHHKVLAIKLAMLNDKLSIERKYVTHLLPQVLPPRRSLHSSLTTLLPPPQPITRQVRGERGGAES